MKKLIVPIIIIIILVGVLGIKMINDPNVNQKIYSREEIIDLMEKAMNYKNYSVEFNSDNYKTIIKVKDNKILETCYSIQDDWTRTVYVDYQTDRKITLIDFHKENGKSAWIERISTTEDSFLVPDGIYYDSTLSFIRDYKYNYNFIKEENINGFKCLKIQLNCIINSYELNSEIWIDKTSGFLIKESACVVDEDYMVTTDYNVKLDCVTDDDVKEPNTEGYEIRASVGVDLY